MTLDEQIAERWAWKLAATHPEKMDDEILLCNTGGRAGREYETVRYGIEAYDVNGKSITEEGFKPVFVKLEEFLEMQKEYAEEDGKRYRTMECAGNNVIVVDMEVRDPDNDNEPTEICTCSFYGSYPKARRMARRIAKLLNKDNDAETEA